MSSCVVTTSGTTALPKSVVHTHGSLVRHAYILARHRGVTSADRIYSPMPFFWVGGLTMVVLQALSTGAAILAQDVFEAGSTLALLERERATFISCWAQASQAMADHPDFAKRDLSSVRGGTMLQALPPDRRPSEPDLTPNLLGMTETGGPHTMVEVPDTPLPPELRGSFGIPLPGVVQHRIVDTASGVEAPAGAGGRDPGTRPDRDERYLQAGTPRGVRPRRLVCHRGPGMVRRGRPPALHRSRKHSHQDRGIQRVAGGGRVRIGFHA